MGKKNKPRIPMVVFLSRAFLLTVVMVSVGWYLTDRYDIGIGYLDKKPCLPHKAFFIDAWDKDLHAGDLIVFRTDERMYPHFPVGVRFVKLIKAGPGDHVSIANGELYINGKRDSSLDPEILEKLGKEKNEFDRDFTLPKQTFWAMGTLPGSYDSRYWGEVNPEQVVGKAYGFF